MNLYLDKRAFSVGWGLPVTIGGIKAADSQEISRKS